MRRRKLGHAFDNEIVKISSPFFGAKSVLAKIDDKTEGWKEGLLSGFSGDWDSSPLSSWRKTALFLPFLLILSGLILRLFHLQVVQGSEYRDLADSNRIKVLIIHAPRGVIYDRSGKILVQNDPGYRLIEQDASRSGEIVSQFVSRDEALKMEVDGDTRFRSLEVDTVRSYPYGEITAHILGYMGQISKDELHSSQFSGYRPGDKVGRGGVEQIYEKTLRGVDGGEIIEVDASGNPVRVLNRIDPIPGQNLYLTIDADLQQEVFKDLKAGVLKVGSCCGAAVVEDPKSGQVLAMASYPSYDPTNLAPALSDPNSPMLNRAIAGEYPPGSTFKIASALAGLSSGKITKSTTYQDTGVMQLGPYSFANWYFSEYGRTEQGGVDIVRALQRSNDIFFYQLGQAIGETTLGNSAKALGLGSVLGIDLPGEEPGLIPTDDWKIKNIGVAWYPGDTLHMAIGQGYDLATPLQIANLISTVAADGRQYPPHLAYRITSPSNRVIKQFRFDSFTNTKFPQPDIDLVKKGLGEVPQTGGTAWPFFSFSIPTAGKTGTAEFGDPKNRTHAWYASYAPVDNPLISMAILVEAGGEGSNTSSPIAKQIYTWYFSKDRNHLTNFDKIPTIATESAKTLGE